MGQINKPKFACKLGLFRLRSQNKKTTSSDNDVVLFSTRKYILNTCHLILELFKESKRGESLTALGYTNVRIFLFLPNSVTIT